MMTTPSTFSSNLNLRQFKGRLFKQFCIGISLICVLLLATLLVHTGKEGLSWLDWQFITSFPSRFPEKAGIKSALYGSVWLILLTGFFAIPIGICSAIYLEEYAPKNKITAFIEINIANLAGIPSIIYGILGLAVFVRGMGFGRSLLSGSLTMTILILPTIIMASREAIKAVPTSIRQAAFALGSTKWQVMRDHVLPCSLSGILTGVILAFSRAIGETAPLIMIGALTFVAFIPESLFDDFTALPIQIFNWTSRPQAAFHELAAAGIIVLLVVLLLMNGMAVWLRQRSRRKIS